ncbi:hypothetical protein [Arenimonas metalli]|uniref:Uncharacterized protein n=1 Tax=Arenimonas metalli CF5-1 TaxID=1384056 RepID=A0A091B5V5_9GAMM|nr:hypothetical protein [Arenimonas metalli]KFN46244.1 hypothetical protein N787_11135 [Arenimonas metalli CF5-1]
MKDLRSLLIDCRIELRKQARDFQKSELCERLDLAIQAQSTATATAALADAAGEAGPTPPAGKTQTVSQVALAWQTAARDLKFSEPAIYTRMGEKVMRLLEARTLVDPATEILQLEARVAELKAQLETSHQAQQALAMEHEALLGAVAKAVPKLKDGGDKLAVALARVAWLRAEADKAGTGAQAASAKRAPEPQDTVPTPELLGAVAAGAATLTKEQREWCVGEAMVLTGFQYTPVELLEKGDAHVARLIVDARKG